MLYLDFLSEVRTRWFLPTAWGEGKHVVVPYCENGELELFRLDHVGELAPGTIGVLEPRRELRGHAERKIDRSAIDLIVIPGLAFDRRGGRLGYGKGYYDRFLAHLHGSATRLAVCFECQLVAEVPVLPHDIRVHMIVTENAIYRTT
jgi:5-formyltetrahydrofolate cyclo-ligase